MAARASAEAVPAGAPERRHMHYSVCRRFPRAGPRDWRGTENRSGMQQHHRRRLAVLRTFFFLEADGGGLFALRDRGTIFKLRNLTAARFPAGNRVMRNVADLFVID